MNDDEKFDAWLKDVAGDYNRPPATVPREAMWEAIIPSLPVATPVGVSPLRPVHRTRWISLAAAAAVLVVVSYQVGRRNATTEEAAPAVASAPAPRADLALYAKAAEQHLGRADALLTSVRSSGTTGTTDPSLQLWARELLSDTRLLLDSPAASDAARQRLLQDLELTLAQIVQLSAASTPDDQRMVERSLQRGELLTRIRTAVPSNYSGT
ncbi:MAG: hypothetical protein H7066_09630 [Cytophagaceae bacterium]|nr:hypothetical protein [Gemmatimonadaceae bacterium]